MGRPDLVEKVKSLQRSDPNLKNAWWEYCDTNYEGVKDPARHDDESLSNFLSFHDPSGAPAAAPARKPLPQGPRKGAAAAVPFGGGKGPAPAMMMQAMGGGASEELVNFIKVGQRLSHPFKDAWKSYCATEGGGANDPNRHDDAYIRRFIDSCGRAVLGQASYAMPAYAPAFVPQAYFPPASMKGFGTVGPAKGMGKKRPGAAMGGPPMKKGAGAADADPEKAELVEKIKALQRSSPESKQSWWDFADTNHGGVRDPNRHESDTLREFLMMFEE